VIETITRTPSSVRVTEWERNTRRSVLVQIKDLFNDHLDYSCTMFKDLVVLNQKMLSVAEKYEMFGESPKAKEELEKFKTNFEILQTYFGEIEERLVDSQSSYNEKVAEIEVANAIIRNFAKIHSLTPSLSTPSHTLPQFQRWVVVNGTAQNKRITATSDSCWAYMEPKLPMNRKYKITLKADIGISDWFKVTLHQHSQDPNIGGLSPQCEISTYTRGWDSIADIVITINEKKVSVMRNGRPAKCTNNSTDIINIPVQSDELYLLVSPYYVGRSAELISIESL